MRNSKSRCGKRICRRYSAGRASVKRDVPSVMRVRGKILSGPDPQNGPNKTRRPQRRSTMNRQTRDLRMLHLMAHQFQDHSQPKLVPRLEEVRKPPLAHSMVIWSVSNSRFAQSNGRWNFPYDWRVERTKGMCINRPPIHIAIENGSSHSPRRIDLRD